MLICTCCELPMTVCECDPGWYTMDEQRRMEPDYPYRYDPGYDWDGEYWGDDNDLPHDLDDPLNRLWHNDWIEEEGNERKTAVMLFSERS